MHFLTHCEDGFGQHATSQVNKMSGEGLSMKRAFSVLALSTTISLAGVWAAPALADTSISGQSLSGNYLAARIANTDKDTENAVIFFRKALARDPENSALQQKAFLTFIANGDFAEGISIGEELTKKGEAPEIARLILSVDSLRRKSWSDAERELSKDWQNALDRLMAGLVLGWAQMGKGDPKQALATIDALEGPAWFDLFTQYHGGLVALSAGDTKDAIRRLRLAYGNTAGGQAANETYMRVAWALVYANMKAGNKERAMELVDEALALQPQSPVFERIKQDLDADRLVTFNVKNTLEGAAEVFMNVGTAINKDGGQQFSRIYLELARVLAGESQTVLLELAELMDQQGLVLRSNDLFGQIPEQSPYYRIARLEIALNLDEQGKLDEARAELDKLIAADPHDLVAHLSYGAVLARHEKFKEAIKIYNPLIARIKEPEQIHWNLYYRQGIAYERTKQWPKAEAAFKKSLELFPNQPNVLNYLGYSWVDMNTNLEEGLRMIRQAVDIRPNDGYMVDSLGWAYYRLGRFEEAVVELERAVELRPGDPTINDHLGDAYWRAGRRLEATFQWQHALALEPEIDQIATIKAKLKDGLEPQGKDKVAKPEDQRPDKG